MRYLFAAILTVLAMSIVNCSPIDQSGLYGTYIADYKLAKEKLVLYEDGTFYQEVMIKPKSEIDKASGTWSYSPREKGDPSSGYIFFDENFMYVPDKFGEKVNPDYAHPKSGTVALPVGRLLRIRIGSGEMRVYKKID